MKRELIVPNYKELTWGLRYLLFQLVFLGSLIALAARLLGLELTALGLNVTYFVMNFLVAVILFREFLLENLRELRPRLAWVLDATVVGFLAYEVLSMVLSMVIYWYWPEFSNVNDTNLTQISRSNYGLLTFCTVALVPLTEEIFYRGILFAGLRRRSAVAAYAVSALAFALVHISGYIGSTDGLTLVLCFVQYLPAGICLAAAYDVTGNILPAVLIHTAVNAIGMMAMR